MRLHAVLGQPSRFEVPLAVIERVHEHLLDRGVVEPVRRLHLDRLLDSGGQLPRVHGEQAVRVHTEGDLELRHPSGHRRDPLQREVGEAPTVSRQLALPLDHVDLEARLLVFLRSVRGARRGRDGRVARQDLVDHPTPDFDPQRQREHVEEQHVVFRPFAREKVGLHRSPQRDHLIGIDVRQRLLPEQLLDVRAHRGNARRAADQDDPIELVRLEARVLQGPTTGEAGAIEERRDARFERRARDRDALLAAARTGIDRLRLVRAR